MRGLTHRWLPLLLDEVPASLAPEGGLEPLVSRILRARGFADASAAAAFCQPRLTELHDPSLLPDLDLAARRLLDALRRNERIVIYGDYDVDGMTATAILFHTMRALHPEAAVATYVPHRLDEGYGLHVEAIEQLARDGAQVIVSVDCGVTAFHAAAAARRAGVDLIITDHHNLPAPEDVVSGAVDGLPDAFAIVHPRRPGSKYPFGDLCGAGVAFKLAWRLATLAQGAEAGNGARVSESMRAVLLDMLALAALGTIADIVPLVGENRLIARHGLARLRSTQLVGLGTLIEVAGLSGESIDAEHVGFCLGPRLNACGRMGHAREAVELLTTATEKGARAIATSLNEMNEERRRIERRIYEEAVVMAEAAGMTGSDTRAIVLAHESWRPGVLGIVCSRLVAKFHRPTILMQRENGACQGSGRSIEGYSLHAGLAQCRDLLTRFGGHDMAAGLALDSSRLQAFTDAFVGHAGAHLTPTDLIPTLRADCSATFEELSPMAVEQLARLGPFGRGNRTPLVLLRSVRLSRPSERFGAQGAHLSLIGESDGCEMRFVGWRWGEKTATIPAGSRIDLIVEPKLNVWNGRRRVEPVIADFRVDCSAG